MEGRSLHPHLKAEPGSPKRKGGGKESQERVLHGQGTGARENTVQGEW